ncbi:NAD(P)H-binding protein [Nocardiopsis sp. MG754419]|uniref:NAD(P)H-binding protein n=1 Tax=Nocardiopsis sp. MG754419 TaxID=2259865 RepID=UPI001BA88FC3|nr:NAD(P)H-binding protein [Nocardiopsis sp. MG754419]MBR8744339.1 epimerase [Nocardiopsis sp. MG754419]
MSTLVTGAGGQLGRRVLTELRRRGLPAVGASRDGEVRLDWTDTASWKPALEGVESLFVTVPMAGGLSERAGAFLQQAAEAGVGTAVLTTAMGAEDGPPDSEQRVLESRVRDLFDRWTIVRPNWLDQDFTEGLFARLARSRNGRLELPLPKRAAVSFVDAADVAYTVVAALTRDEHHEREYTLTGPAPITFREVVKQTKGTESPVWRYKKLDEAGFYFRATNMGWSERYVDTLNERFRAIANGRAAVVTEDVRRALGRDPVPFAKFVREAVI